MTGTSPPEPDDATMSGLSGTVQSVDPAGREFALEHLTGVPPAIITVPPDFGEDLLQIMRPGTRWAAWARSVEDGLELLEIQALPGPRGTRGWPPSWFEEGTGQNPRNAARHWGSVPRPPWFQDRQSPCRPPTRRPTP